MSAVPTAGFKAVPRSHHLSYSAMVDERAQAAAQIKRLQERIEALDLAIEKVDRVVPPPAPIMAPPPPPVSPPTKTLRPHRTDAIMQATCIVLGIDQRDLSGGTRHQRVVSARAIITYLCRELTTMSYPEIARAIGRPNHSTVITAHDRLRDYIQIGIHCPLPNDKTDTYPRVMEAIKGVMGIQQPVLEGTSRSVGL